MKVGLANLTGDTGSELVSPAPCIRCYPQLYSPQYYLTVPCLTDTSHYYLIVPYLTYSCIGMLIPVFWQTGFRLFKTCLKPDFSFTDLHENILLYKENSFMYCVL